MVITRLDSNTNPCGKRDNTNIPKNVVSHKYPESKVTD